MTNIKKIVSYTALAVFVLGVLIFLAARLGIFGNRATDASVGGTVSSEQFSTPGVPATFQIPAGETVQIGTPRGTVVVKNFYKNVVATDEEFFILQKIGNYVISYDTMHGNFTVEILGAPVNETRKAAEENLLNLLDITRADACKLKVIEGISRELDKNLADKSYPLSFCASVIQ